MSNPFDQFEEPANPFDAFGPEPGILAGMAGSLRRGLTQAGQAVDAMALSAGARLSSEAEDEPTRIASERQRDPAPKPENWQPGGSGIGGARGYEIAQERWAQREREREERLANNQRFVEGMHRGRLPALASAINRRSDEIEAEPRREAMRRWDEAPDLGSALKLLVNPFQAAEIIGNLAVEGLGSSAPALGMTVAGAAVAGPGGMIAGQGAGSFSVEYGLKIVEELQEAGVDFADPETLLPLLQDRERMEAIRTKATKRGVPVAFFDAASAGFAGRLFRKPAQALLGKVGQGAAEIGAQAAAGGAGEVAGSLAVGDEIQGKDVLAEMLGEIGSGAGEVATGLALRRRQAARQPAIDIEAKPVPEATTPAPPAPEPDGIEAMLAGEIQRREQMARDMEAEAKARAERQEQVKAKRDALAGHLETATQLAADPEATAAQVQGAVTTLRSYIEDNALGLTLDQRREAEGLLTALRPAHDRLQAAEQQAADARATAAREEQARKEAEQKERIRTERAALRQQADLDPTTGRKRIERMTEDELAAEAEGGNERALRELMRRSEAPERGPAEDLLTVLKRVKLPAADAQLRGELEQLKREQVNFGQRAQIFDTKPGSLDSVAETLRTQYGFDDIVTPNDVITHAQRALAGETILPTWRTSGEQVEFARGQAGPTLEEIRQGWDTRGIQNFAAEKNGVITLSEIRVPKGQRGQGIGTTAMEELVDYADRTSQSVVLSPSVDFGASSKNRLVQFYRRFGFVENKGQNRDFTISETMLRRPRKLRTEQVEFATAEREISQPPLPPPPPRDWKGPDAPQYMRELEAYRSELAAWVKGAPDVIPFQHEANENNIALVSRNTTSEKPWRVTYFNFYRPTGHAEASTKLEAVQAALMQHEYSPDVQFALRGDEGGVLSRRDRERIIRRGEGQTAERIPPAVAAPVAPIEPLPEAAPVRKPYATSAEDIAAIDAKLAAGERLTRDEVKARMRHIEEKIRRGALDRDQAARLVNKYLRIKDGKAHWAVADWHMTEEEAMLLHLAVKRFDETAQPFVWPEQVSHRWRYGMQYARELPGLPDNPAQARLALDDFQNRLQRIAPGLMGQYRALVGDADMLVQLGVRREQLTGREQAAHFERRKILWFLAQNVRADRDGLLPERTRRDVLHEASHAWLKTLEADDHTDLINRWRQDLTNPDGWLAGMRLRGTKLRAGVETDWAEYWAERLAQENNHWAARRERGALVGEQGFIRQLAAEFRTWLMEALEYLRQAFTRTKRYNVDYRAFLTDERFAAGEPETTPGQPVETAQQTMELGMPLGIELPASIRNLTPRWQDKQLQFESTLDKALYYAGGEGNTTGRDSVIASLNEQTGLSNGQIATLARSLREKLRPLAANTASEGTLRVPPQMRTQAAALTGVEYSRTDNSWEGRQQQARQRLMSAGYRTAEMSRGERAYMAMKDGYQTPVLPTWQEVLAQVEKDQGTVQAAAGQQVLFAREEQSPEQRRGALLRELNDLNRSIAELEKKSGQRSRAAARELLGQRSELRSQLDSEFPEWRQANPALARGEPTSLPDRKAELMQLLKKAEAEVRADKIGAESWAARYRADLDREFPGWETPRQPQTKGDGPTTDASAQPDTLTEASPFNETAEEYASREGIHDQVKGHTTVRPGWLARSWEKTRELLRGLRGAIPELPAFADDRSHKFLRLRQFFRNIKRGTPRVWKEASDQLGEIVQPLLALGVSDPNGYARLGRLQQRVRQLTAENRPVPDPMRDEIAALNRKFERDPYVLFQNLALYLDLKWRVENLKDDRGNPIVQPLGVNSREVNEELARLQDRLAASPHRAAVLRALQQHQQLVRTIAADLRQRDLRMPEDYENPFYFPHILLDANRDVLERVKLDTQEDFRGYLMKPVGSARAIETDYIKAMYYHLVAVGSHNLRSDLVRDYVQPYDTMAEVKERATALSEKYGRPVSWREAYHTEFSKQGYVLYHPDDKLPMHPEMTVSRDVLARRLGVALTEAPLQNQLDALGLKGIKLLPEDITEALAAGERETWVLPETVAEALNGMLRRETRTADSLISKPIQAAQLLWKRNILFAPWNYPRYEFNNTTADVEKLFSADPEVFRRLPEAAREVRQFIEEGKGSRDVREAFKLGVLDSVTAAEVNDLPTLRQFEALKTKGDNTRDMLRRATTLFLAGNRSTVHLSKLREATFRFAKFKADLERLRNGARPVYAGAYWRDIDAIEDSRPGAKDANYHKAAEISLATFGDYNNLTVTGQELRRYIIPFYSWIEINFRYHVNLFRNMKDMVAASETTAAEAAKTGTRAAAALAATFTRKAAAGFLLRLALPYAAVMLWNNTGDREELEETLSEEDRRRFHIILGKDANGKTMVVYGATALQDVLRYFSGNEAMQAAVDVATGRTDLKTAFSGWLQKFPRDFLNNIYQVGPAVNIAYTLMARKRTFPDITDQRTIPAQDVSWAVLAQATDHFTADMVRRAADKDYLAPRDMKDWAQQVILQVRKRDPEQWAFYAMKEKAGEFLEAKTGRSRTSGEYNAPDQQVLRNFRRAIYKADVENAMRFYERLLEYGYTAERFQSSIRAQEPLSELPKDLRREFVDGLSRFDREQLTRAYQFYGRMAENRGAERALFPSKNWPEASQQNFRPRTERLARAIERVEERNDDEAREKAERELRRSLLPAR